MVDDDDRRVKDLVAAAQAGDASIDPQTAADLARWFGLPSFQEIEEAAARPKPAAPEDPEVVARREAIERAIAAVDPALSASLNGKLAGADSLIRFEALDLLVIDPDISSIDPVMLQRGDIAAPREVELPRELFDDLRQCAPQAILRDLHRPELQFPLRLEVDPTLEAALPVDVTEIIREALRPRGSPIDRPPALREIRDAFAPLREAKREAWSELRTPGRRVSE